MDEFVSMTWRARDNESAPPSTARARGRVGSPDDVTFAALARKGCSATEPDVALLEQLVESIRDGGGVEESKLAVEDAKLLDELG